MRTSQYACILALQIVVLFAMMSFSLKFINPPSELDGATDTSDVREHSGNQGIDDLRERLSR